MAYRVNVLRALSFVALFACGRFGFGDEHNATGDGGSDSSTAGDGSLPGFTPFWKSGSRLRARLWQPVDGGDPYFAYWRDITLDTDCTSTTSADGVERCVPEHATADQFFADAACTQRLTWSHFGPCAHDKFAYYYDAANRAHEFPIGAQYGGPVYAMSPTCTATVAPSNGTLYSLGAEEPASSFLATGYQTRTVGGFSHVFTKWSDGAEYDNGALLINGSPCSPTGGFNSGTSTCEPTSDPFLVPVFTDAACTQPAFYWDGTGNSPLGTGEFLVAQRTLCGHPFAFYQVGSDVTGASYYARSLGTCSNVATPSGAHVFLGNAATPQYPTGTVTPGAVAGRLGHLYWTGPDGVSIAIAYWDHQLGRSCWPFVASDGVFRCLPRRPLLVDGYPNATCNGATVQIAGSCYGDVPVNSPSYPTCDDQWGNVTEMQAAPGGSYDNQSACAQFPGTTYVPVGTTTVLPPSTFEQLTQVIE